MELGAWCFVLLLACICVSAQTNAYDDAFPYNKQTWITNALNAGFGFTPWALKTSGSQFSGFFTTHDPATLPTPTINSPTNTALDPHPHIWGLYGNGSGSTNIAAAFRGFLSPLATNQSFALQWQNDGVNGGNGTSISGVSMGGFCLRNGNTTNSTANLTNGQRFSFYQIAGGANAFTVADGNGAQLIGLPFTTTGLNCEFTLLTADTYRFVIRNATNASVLAFRDNQPLAGTPGSTLNSVAMFAKQTGANQEFNRMQIVSRSNLPPVIVSVQPTNGASFYNPLGMLMFEVDASGWPVAPAGVALYLNDVAQPLAFNTNAPASRLLVTNAVPLATNGQYRAVVVATDTGGLTATNIFTFDTMVTNSLWMDVKAFGAAGNGTTKDTTNIQAAIDACPPGGFVWLHNGTFLSGTIRLKNNITLYIDPTATLLGSGSVSDYPDIFPPLSNSQTSNCRKALVYAESCTNITITGGGTINGNGRNNFTSGVESTRPIPIWTTLCNQVRLFDFFIVDAAMWTVVPMQSDNLDISYVEINDDGLNGNRDGIDLVDCWNVTISDCTFNTGDDAICIKSGNSSRGTRNVLVKNCVVTRSQSNGIKFGTASKGPFTNLVFQDCVLQNVAHSAMAVESVDGSAINNITFQRIQFSACQNAIFVILGTRNGVAVGSINGLTYRDITGYAMSDTRGNPISGYSTNGNTWRLQNLLFDNVAIEYKGGVGSIPSAPPEYSGQYPENTMWGNLPAYAYYIRHAQGVTFTNCFTSALATDARPWLSISDVTNLTISGPTLRIIQPSPLVLQWDQDFTLQTSTNFTGGFSDLTTAVSPYTNPFPATPQRLFRLRQ